MVYIGVVGLSFRTASLDELAAANLPADFRTDSLRELALLSGLALARAWSTRPDVLLLDEPTASLDPHAKREVETLLDELAAQGMTLLMASHQLGQVKRFAERVIYLEHGRVLADLPVHDFFDGSAPPEARLFLKGELPW